MMQILVRAMALLYITYNIKVSSKSTINTPTDSLSAHPSCQRKWERARLISFEHGFEGKPASMMGSLPMYSVGHIPSG